MDRSSPPQPQTPAPSFPLSELIRRLRWRVPLVALALVFTHLAIERLLASFGEGARLAVDLMFYGAAIPLLLWFTLDWLQREIARKESAEAGLTRLQQQVSLLAGANRRLSQAAGGAGSVTPLSLRETEILQLVAKGLTNREIAGRLLVSDNTVKTHLARIFEKLGTTSRAATVALARTRGWLPPG